MTDGAPAPKTWWSSLSLPVVSICIASLSLAASISQSLNYRKNIETAQQNVLRGENLRSCKEIIEIFFALRLRAETANAATTASETEKGTALREMKMLVYRFGALGTHIANFTPAQTRARYAALSWQLLGIAEQASTLSSKDFDQKYADADKAFEGLNADCARMAQVQH